jgi:hypothetical protein
MLLCNRATSLDLSPVETERAHPISAFQPTTKNRGGLFVLSPPVASLVDFDRPAVTHWTRWCQGGSLDQGEPMGGGRAEGAHHRGLAAVREDDGDGSN